MKEAIEWLPAAAPPDVDVTVLLYGSDYEEVFIGARDTDEDDQECWRDNEGFVCDYEITHWAHLPAGPLADTQSTEPEE